MRPVHYSALMLTDTPPSRAGSLPHRISGGTSLPITPPWLASPGYCANLMNPMFTQVGAAFATDTRSNEGVYWTMLFGAK